VPSRQPKIAMIGAGGVVFPLRLMGDLLAFPALQDATYSLMDLDLGRAERTAAQARELAAHYGFGAEIAATDDQREALRDADYVFVTFMVGGVEVYRHDMEIPRKYGVDQRIGDTLGPGGVFRFLRNVPAYHAIAEEMHELCPNALLINYANPMAMNCWYLTELGIETVGVCHSVQHTTHMLAEHIGLDYDKLVFNCAGINHQSWFVTFEDSAGNDLRPLVRERMTDIFVTRNQRDPDPWKDELVRTEIMNAFGYFHTESSMHASEYLPYFRKREDLIDRFVPTRWNYEAIRDANLNRQADRSLLDRMLGELVASDEYGSWIVNAMETGRPTVIYGNVPNSGLIDNLSPDACVEVACLVDRNGIQPTHFGALPPQCAAVNETNINVQRLAVEAALTGQREHVYHAVMFDPLTAAVCSLDEIRSMVDELFAANEGWLPELV
jgi:alpha-galactosidase